MKLMESFSGEISRELEFAEEYLERQESIYSPFYRTSTGYSIELFTTKPFTIDPCTFETTKSIMEKEAVMQERQEIAFRKIVHEEFKKIISKMLGY